MTQYTVSECRTSCKHASILADVIHVVASLRCHHCRKTLFFGQLFCSEWSQQCLQIGDIPYFSTDPYLFVSLFVLEKSPIGCQIGENASINEFYVSIFHANRGPRPYKIMKMENMPSLFVAQIETKRCTNRGYLVSSETTVVSHSTGIQVRF